MFEILCVPIFETTVMLSLAQYLDSVYLKYSVNRILRSCVMWSIVHYIDFILNRVSCDPWYVFGMWYVLAPRYLLPWLRTLLMISCRRQRCGTVIQSRHYALMASQISGHADRCSNWRATNVFTYRSQLLTKIMLPLWKGSGSSFVNIRSHNKIRSIRFRIDHDDM